MKNARYPETNDVIDELKTVSPMEVRPDPSAWREIVDGRAR